MTQSEVNALKSIVSTVKSRLEAVRNKTILMTLEESPLCTMLIISSGIGMMEDKELDEYLMDLSDAIDDLEDALATAEITE